MKRGFSCHLAFLLVDHLMEKLPGARNRLTDPVFFQGAWLETLDSIHASSEECSGPIEVPEVLRTKRTDIKPLALRIENQEGDRGTNHDNCNEQDPKMPCAACSQRLDPFFKVPSDPLDTGLKLHARGTYL